MIKTELVDARDGSHLWGEAYSCDQSDIFDVETKISKEISEKLLLRLTAEERKRLEKRYTDNTEAYHAYLKGRHFWNKRTDEGVRQAIEHFKQAIDHRPELRPGLRRACRLIPRPRIVWGFHLASERSYAESARGSLARA